MQYNENFETRDDVFKYSLNGINFYFVPNNSGKYEFCTKEDTNEDFKVSLWMTRVKRKEVDLDHIPFVIRDAIIKGAKADVSKQDILVLRRDISRFADKQGIKFKEIPISNKIRPPMSRKIKVLGLAVEKYLEEWSDCHDLDRTTENERYKLIVQDIENKNKYIIELTTSHGSCGSGYCNSSYGHLKISKFDKKMPFTHIVKPNVFIEGFSINPDTLEYYQVMTPYASEKKSWDLMYEDSVYNNIFEYSPIGGDSYYPSGGVYVKMDNFKKLERAMDKRPVWIIKGPSGSGKSTLANHLDGLSVFETDSVDELPKVIYDDVIVLGNRSNFSTEDVKQRLFGEPDVIEVSFDRGEKTKERQTTRLPYKKTGKSI